MPLRCVQGRTLTIASVLMCRRLTNLWNYSWSLICLLCAHAPVLQDAGRLIRQRLRHTVGRSIASVRRMVAGPEVSPRRIRRFLAGADLSKTAGPWAIPGSLTIVVPCFGHAAHLQTMFESIVRQTRPADEVIFVEDRSPDDTAAILAGLITGRPNPSIGRFSLLHNERNLGQAATLNRGIGAARCDLIMVLNDDDYLMHDAVAVTLERFAQHPELGLIGAHSIHFAGDEVLAAAPKTSDAYPGARRPLVVRRPADVLRYRSYNDLNMTHSSSCFRRAAWAAVGGYYADGQRRVVPFSDRDFQLRVNALWPVGVAVEAPLAFWRTDSSVDAGRNS